METASENDLEQTQYLAFRVAGEDYAINVLRVKEIIEYDTLTKLPNTPPSIRGVINLRGSVVPVLDLAVKFNQPPTEATKLACVVILEMESSADKFILGVMAESVSQVMEIPPEDIQDAPAMGTTADARYLSGMVKSGKKFILLLNVDKFLSEDASALSENAAPEKD